MDFSLYLFIRRETNGFLITHVGFCSDTTLFQIDEGVYSGLLFFSNGF